MPHIHKYMHTYVHTYIYTYVRYVFKKLYYPLIWIGFNCLKATEPLLGDSLL